jgi:hypothetical protein
MKIMKLSRRNMAFAGLAVLVLAGSPVLFASAVDHPAAQGESCENSTSSVKQLAMLDSTRGDTFQCIGVALDGNALRALHVETHSFKSSDRSSASEQVKVTEFSNSDFESDRGAVLDGVPGHDAIVLRGHLSTAPARSELVASYLYNGFTGEYRSCPITLGRTPGNGWHLFDRFDQTISHIVVRTRKIPVIGVFGIATLEGACT